MSAALPIALVAYRIATTLAAPAAPLLLAWRARREKEDPARAPERLARPSRDRPDGELVWAHGASIGETLSLLPVVEALTRQGLPVVVTSGTRTAAEVLRRRLPAGAFHQYVPLDLPGPVDRFLDHWRPSLALFAESEIWPNMILGLERRAVPLILINGRLSSRSYERWRRAPGVAGALLGRFTLCIAQSAEDGERLARLGAPVAGVSGNLKFDIAPPPADPAAVERLAGQIAGRPLWMAASTHPGEEDAVLHTHAALHDRHRDLLTILAPRHPNRAAGIVSDAQAMGFAVSRRSTSDRIDPADHLHVVDTVGDLGLFYRVAPLVFMGGSLEPLGGHNPIEPVRLGAAVLHGPRTENFRDIYTALDRDGGALGVADAEALAHAVGNLLADPGLTRDMARAGAGTVASFAGALERTLAAIAPYLPARPEAAARAVAAP